MKILVCCTNYNTYQELDSFLNSIEKAGLETKEVTSISVIVCDNSEKKREYDYNGNISVQIIKANRNFGYLGGIIEGIRHSTKSLSNYDYIILSNVDLTIDEKLFSELEEIQDNGNVGCYAPSIFSQTEGINRNPKVLKRYSRNQLETLRLLFKFPILWYLYNSILHKKRRKRIGEKNNTEKTIYAPHGSFMIFTNSFASFLQDMSFHSFLFCEELFFAENLRKRGLEVVFKPNLVVYDIDHVSTSRIKKRDYFKYNYQSLTMILKDYYNE